MFNRMVIKKALKNTWKSDNYPVWTRAKPGNGQSSIISLLIYDIFGGEILKTHKKKGWHFYNRIDGECIDFTKSEMSKSSGINRFEDIPSTPDETYSYFEHEDYSAFFLRFIWAFEEAVGFRKSQRDFTT